MPKTNTCPVCKGKGEIAQPRTTLKEQDDINLKHDMAKTLVDAGYSYREVAKFLNYKSPSTVGFAIKKK